MVRITLIVGLLLAGLFVVGVILILRSAIAPRPDQDTRVCPKCQTANPPQAKFCGHCGRALG
ncbi:MAG: zinc-ribbon domain-containing protein [Phycisphaerae bacterium]